jgi:hypothetical protein
MSVTLQQVDQWLRAKEDEHLEFKEARNQYSTEKLIRYCSALANERGGNMVLGVTNRKPRRVVGTNAFADLNDIKAKLVERLRLRIEATVLDHPDVSRRYLSSLVQVSIGGAPGLGRDVVAAITRLDLGLGLVSGAGVVILAIFLDRVTSAFREGPAMVR